MHSVDAPNPDPARRRLAWLALTALGLLLLIGWWWRSGASPAASPVSATPTATRVARPGPGPVGEPVAAPDAPELPAELPPVGEPVCAGPKCAGVGCRLTEFFDTRLSGEAAVILPDGSRRMVLLRANAAWLWTWEAGEGTLSLPGFAPEPIRWTGPAEDGPGSCMPDPVVLHASETAISGTIALPGERPEGTVRMIVEGCERSSVVTQDGRFFLEVRPGRCQLTARAEVETSRRPGPEPGETVPTIELVGWAHQEVQAVQGEEVQVELVLERIDPVQVSEVVSQLTDAQLGPDSDRVVLDGETVGAAAFVERLREGCGEQCDVESTNDDQGLWVRLTDPVGALIVERGFADE